LNLDTKAILTDVMQSEKQLATAYCQAELESANLSLRESFRRIQQNVQENHGKLFHEMHQRGWYKTPVAGQQAIESTIISWEQKFQKEPNLNPNQKQ
jgi:spore coat protein CotF